MTSFILILISIAIVVGAAVLLSIARGFVLSYLWFWFMTPFGLPEIGVAHSIGVAVMITFLTYQFQQRESSEAWQAIFQSILQCPIALGVGWIVWQVMY